MSRALVIKGANFAENKLTTISFVHDTPCTGIAFDQTAISITDYAPVTIAYTLTPADTTDTLIWSVSDETVIGINNGVVTAVGVGSATVTATCGSVSASIQVSVESLPYNPNWFVGAIGDTAANYFTYNNLLSRISAFGAGQQQGEYYCVPTIDAENRPVILLPKNTKRVRITISNPSMIYNGSFCSAYWTQDVSCGESGTLAVAAKKIANGEFFNGRTITDNIVEVPEGADSMLFVARLATNAESVDIDANALAQTIGISFTFLPAA